MLRKTKRFTMFVLVVLSILFVFRMMVEKEQLQQLETTIVPPNITLSVKELKRLKEAEERDKLEEFVLKEYEERKDGDLMPNYSLPLPRPLLFIHIPKTAGSTLVQVFKNNVDPHHFKHLWSHPRVSELAPIPKRDVIYGHFRYGLHMYFNRTCTYATMLREPVSRVISYYFYHLQDVKDPMHKFAKNHTFEEWLELSQGAHNEMTKCLSGIRSGDIPTWETFEIAKYHLQHAGFVGITENFHESLVLMKRYFGFDFIKYRSTKIGHMKPKTVDDRLVEKIREYNMMDIELYEIAQMMFAKQLERMGPTFKQEVDSFRNALVGGWSYYQHPME